MIIRLTRSCAASRQAHHASAFTLVELVVVIGIIAIAAGLLLPAIASLRGGTNDIECQNNMRQLFQALVMYNNDYRGSMPYGFYFVNSHPVTWTNQGPGTDYVSWISLLNEYLGGSSGSLSPAFKCPEAAQVAAHRVSYVMNWIVGIAPLYELQVGEPPRAQTRPPNVNLMLKEGTALIWDTAIRPNWQDSDGHLISADLDAQRFWQGAAVPQFRYFLAHDPFGQIPPGTFGNNRPVQLSLPGFPYKNVDPPQSVLYFPYQGNLRFRHNGETTCNVAFSDGTVRKFTATLAPTRPQGVVSTHDALRRYFMIDWPPGVTPNPNYPSRSGYVGSVPGGGLERIRSKSTREAEH